MKHLLLLTLFIILTISCNKDEIGLNEKNITTADLIGCWNHDYEIQTNNKETTYLMTKCEAKDFPNSWFRYSLIFEGNDKGSELLLAQNDAHSYSEIIWSLSGNRLTIDGTFQQVEYNVEVISEESIILTTN